VRHVAILVNTNIPNLENSNFSPKSPLKTPKIRDVNNDFTKKPPKIRDVNFPPLKISNTGSVIPTASASDTGSVIHALANSSIINITLSLVCLLGSGDVAAAVAADG